MELFGVEIDRISTRYGRMYIPSRDTVIGRSLRMYGEWAEHEISFLSDLVDNQGIILDVGANIGVHSLAFASRFPDCLIYAFEPQPLAFTLLSANVLSTGLPNVQPFSFAAGARFKLAELSTGYEEVEWNVGAVKLETNRCVDSVKSPVVVLALESLSFPAPVRLMKIDVEGMEADVLRGAATLIARDRPTIYFEVLKMEAVASSRDLLVGLGYELRWLETNAFNPNNIVGETRNVWGRGETGIIALPHPNDTRVASLPMVTGVEDTVPRERYFRETAP